MYIHCYVHVNFTFLIYETNIKRNVFTYCGTNFKKYSNKLIHFIKYQQIFEIKLINKIILKEYI